MRPHPRTQLAPGLLGSPVRVRSTPPVNRARPPTASGRPIDEQHVSRPGLTVLDITAPDEATVIAVMADLVQRWATARALLCSCSRHPGCGGPSG
ncbi:DUF6207 family protein [Streptomyces sp. NPDC048295]|uniref:DUF6207 family protein n=1 Tax=Streptomyces sp. NPDC048295 TaxID=3154617 RepID=UPI00342F9C02